MKWIISRYNNDLSYLPEYTDDYLIYDRSEVPLEGSVVVPNIGSDLYDKFTYIIDKYDNLPDVALYTKGNLFKFITKEEFDLVKDNKTFTPLLTKNHREIPYVSFYKGEIYWEVNNFWYLGAHPTKHDPELLEELLGIREMSYLPFAPGCSYILPKENILKHSKEFYKQLREYLEWDRYPGEAMVIERSLYTLWK